MQIVQLDDFVISVPDRYEVVHHDAFESTSDLVRSLGGELGTRLEQLFDWKTVASSRLSRQITMQEHRLSFFLNRLAKLPPGQYSKLFYESMSREPLPDDALEDVQVRDLSGKKIGSYSDGFSHIEWCFAADGLLVHIAISGPGHPAEDVREDVERIVQSLRHVANPAPG